ncbi:faciogenital dysplasia protein [Anaeramoeba flamelloides]|uniref:Faciogenital dysplasia protein n=1 Tax=Anaeramoeba flamelloides TaxID=1746091 RepID=A0ABQ8XZK5_9EUKA|nr:faciogenital dysplasia protein [Anaeramoeba flamelloides]
MNTSQKDQKQNEEPVTLRKNQESQNINNTSIPRKSTQFRKHKKNLYDKKHRHFSQLLKNFSIGVESNDLRKNGLEKIWKELGWLEFNEAENENENENQNENVNESKKRQKEKELNSLTKSRDEPKNKEGSKFENNNHLLVENKKTKLEKNNLGDQSNLQEQKNSKVIEKENQEKEKDQKKEEDQKKETDLQIRPINKATKSNDFKTKRMNSPTMSVSIKDKFRSAKSFKNEKYLPILIENKTKKHKHKQNKKETVLLLDDDLKNYLEFLIDYLKDQYFVLHHLVFKLKKTNEITEELFSRLFGSLQIIVNQQTEVYKKFISITSENNSIEGIYFKLMEFFSEIDYNIYDQWAQNYSDNLNLIISFLKKKNENTVENENDNINSNDNSGGETTEKKKNNNNKKKKKKKKKKSQKSKKTKNQIRNIFIEFSKRSPRQYYEYYFQPLELIYHFKMYLKLFQQQMEVFQTENETIQGLGGNFQFVSRVESVYQKVYPLILNKPNTKIFENLIQKIGKLSIIDLYSPNRKLLNSGTLIKILREKKSLLKYFLFNDLLILAKPIKKIKNQENVEQKTNNKKNIPNNKINIKDFQTKKKKKKKKKLILTEILEIQNSIVHDLRDHNNLEMKIGVEIVLPNDIQRNIYVFLNEDNKLEFLSHITKVKNLKLIVAAIGDNLKKNKIPIFYRESSNNLNKLKNNQSTTGTNSNTQSRTASNGIKMEKENNNDNTNKLGTNTNYSNNDINENINNNNDDDDDEINDEDGDDDINDEDRDGNCNGGEGDGDGDDQENEILFGKITKIEKRSHVIMELIKTEKEYLNDLKIILNLYLNPIKEQKIVKLKDISAIFSSIETIAGANEILYQRLMENYPKEDLISNVGKLNVGKIILELGDYLKSYTLYCSNHELALKTIAHYRKKSNYQKFIQDRILNYPQVRKLKLSDFLIKPIQRICRYPLFFSQLLKATSIDYDDYDDLKNAFLKLSGVTDYVNEKKRSIEASMRILSIVERISGISNHLQLIDPARKFIMEGTLKKKSVKRTQERYFWLFTDLLLYAKPSFGKGKFQYKGHFFLNDIALRDIIYKKENKFLFQIIPSNSNKAYTIFCENQEQKDSWFNSIKTQMDFLQNNNENVTFVQK